MGTAKRTLRKSRYNILLNSVGEIMLVRMSEHAVLPPNVLIDGDRLLQTLNGRTSEVCKIPSECMESLTRLGEVLYTVINSQTDIIAHTMIPVVRAS